MFDENVQISYLRSARECGSNVREGRAAGVRRDMGELGETIGIWERWEKLYNTLALPSSIWEVLGRYMGGSNSTILP